ncbi:MAG TPA: SRPBCC family protein [Microvirga sp.]|jgi:uncharacterized protein YndB with AHSA1/START domain|nr:SRPBCC family protein [Microvirga sp.]
MAKAYASAIIDAPVETVWSVLRDFNGLPNWHPAIVTSEIEDGLDADVVGCVRSFRLQDGALVRERLLAFSDADRSLTYNFETPAFPVENYLASIRALSVTSGDRTFVEWEATFDEAPEDRGKYVEIISNAVFQSGWTALKAKVAGMPKPTGAERWKAGRPNKVWCSSVMNGPVDQVWGIMRDFAGMGGWHDEITRMHMIGGVRSDKVSGVRDFYFGEGQLHEELLSLSDLDRSFSYRITKSPMPWIGYVAGARLYRVTDGDLTFGVWTADWAATAEHDPTLQRDVHENVFQKAFDTINTRFGSTVERTYAAA